MASPTDSHRMEDPVSNALYALVKPTPCCARITPTGRRGLHAWWDRLVDHGSDLLRRLRAARTGRDALPWLDEAMLRDLGLSHRQGLHGARRRLRGEEG